MKFMAAVSIAALTCGVSAVAGDWSVWRGPNQDGITAEKVSPQADFTKPVWQARIGAGYSAVSVYQGKLLAAGNSKIDGKETDTIYCLDAKTGKEIWKYSYECSNAGGFPGPRGTPVTDGTNVYLLSRTGLLNCLSLADGKNVWTVNIMQAHGAQNLQWCFGSSVVIKGDRIYINAGAHGMAFEKATGKAVWANEGGLGNYATPVLFSCKSKDYVAVFSGKKFHVVNEKDGSEVASVDWVTKYNINACDAMVMANGTKIFVASGYDKASAVLDFDGQTLKPLWKNQNLGMQFNTPVLINGLLYGANGNTGGGKLRAVDCKTGEAKWDSQLGFGSLLYAGGTLVYMEEKGTLSLITPNADQSQVVKTVPIFQGGKSWTMPVLANGLLYLRHDSGDLRCYKVD